MADDLEQSIRENAQQPAKTSVNAVSVAQQSLADQIEADRHLASEQATRSTRLGLRLTKGSLYKKPPPLRVRGIREGRPHTAKDLQKGTFVTVFRTAATKPPAEAIPASGQVFSAGRRLDGRFERTTVGSR